MRVRLVGLLALGCVLTLILSFSGAGKGRSQTSKGPAGTSMSGAERDLLNEINQARANPQVSCGPHPEFQIMCVLNPVGGFVEPVRTTTTTPANSNVNSNKSKPPTKKSTKP